MNIILLHHANPANSEDNVQLCIEKKRAGSMYRIVSYRSPSSQSFKTNEEIKSIAWTDWIGWNSSTRKIQRLDNNYKMTQKDWSDHTFKRVCEMISTNHKTIIWWWIGKCIDSIAGIAIIANHLLFLSIHLLGRQAQERNKMERVDLP